MKQAFKRVFPDVRFLPSEVKQFLPLTNVSILQKRSGYLHNAPKGGPPLKRQKYKEWTPSFYKWKYKPLPKQTSLDTKNPLFAIRPPDFKMPSRNEPLSRKRWRQMVAEVSTARQDPELEKLARNRQLKISIDEVEENWREEYGLSDVSKLSNFYGINRDVFNNKDIKVSTFLDISFDTLKIHRGNMVEPAKLSYLPRDVEYTHNEDYLTTLILTNLDGHPLDSSKEILHWLVCNIPNGKLSEGYTAMDYLPPIPWKGTGYHRHVFVLYKHINPIVINDVIGDANTLGGRTFSSWDFTSSLNMAPVGMAWCQVQWDESVSSSCSLLKDIVEEPIFDLEEYIEPKKELEILQSQLRDLQYRDM